MRLDLPQHPHPGVTLRAAMPEDDTLLRALYRSSREPELALTGWDEAQRAAFADSQFGMQDRWYRQNYPGAQFLVVERDALPVGRLYLQASGGVVQLMDITLAPEVRDRGLGTILVRWLQERAGAAGLAVGLHVEQANPARALYRRLGFEEAEAEGVYVRMRWTPGAWTTGG